MSKQSWLRRLATSAIAALVLTGSFTFVAPAVVKAEAFDTTTVLRSDTGSTSELIAGKGIVGTGGTGGEYHIGTTAIPFGEGAEVELFFSVPYYKAEDVFESGLWAQWDEAGTTVTAVAEPQLAYDVWSPDPNHYGRDFRLDVCNQNGLGRAVSMTMRPNQTQLDWTGMNCYLSNVTLGGWTPSPDISGWDVYRMVGAPTEETVYGIKFSKTAENYGHISFWDSSTRSWVVPEYFAGHSVVGDFCAESTVLYFDFAQWVNAGETPFKVIVRELNGVDYTADFSNGVPTTVGAVTNMSLSAADDFGLNFYADLPCSTMNAKASIALAGKEAVTVVGEYAADKDLWRFTCPVAAKDYDKSATFTLTERNGKAIANGASAAFSVKEYADKIAAGEYDAGVKTLVAELDEYCKAAQNYFGGVAVEKITQNVVTAADLAAYKGSVSGAQAGVELVGATLVLESKTKVCVYFKAESLEGVETSHTAKAVNGEENLYVIEIPVVARDLSTVQTVTIGGITVNYSALSYVEAVLSSANTNAALYNVVQEIYDCSVAADAYLG